ncbi:hypothetical protein OXPF_26680 [Oxobacter pfennigii]|uniref:DUF3786 domain-containing protein n=1 Tax=Oxobacter pfennigii TaxID=36849 RepID=A0A0N8NT45_9CLOT|nr:DUF3786 domain-containing protein [Oxobacter pfennigii]KPU43808.1 hypothetical protein OXPF_26680 [Oxobacter pfennigii]
MESNLMNAYLTAYKIACHQFKERSYEEIALNSNSTYDANKNSIQLKYLNKEYIIDCSTGEIYMAEGNSEVPVTVKVLILHYLLHSKSALLKGKTISFKEVQGGGAIYYQAFSKRAVAPMIKTFANNPEGLYKASERLDGTIEKFGHGSVTLKIFPMVPVTYVIWQGDDEVPPSGTILFDESVENFLPVEDIVLAASYGVYEMIKLAKS